MSNEPTLLVVDDEEAICEGCRRIFSHQGFAVQKCSDANEGLTKATRDEYAAILLDVKMPGMDGLQFLETLRKSKPNVPVVLMTGYPSIPNAASAVRLGASDYVTKPFTPEEISQAVHRLLHEAMNPVAANAADAPVSDATFRFYREAWYQTNDEGVARVGALVAGPGVAKIESIRLPKIGEVVQQGLPLASITVAGKCPRLLPSPVSGVVVAVNDALSNNPSLLLTDPCGQGWIACVSPTRLEEESQKCPPHRVLLLSEDVEGSTEQAERLRRLGCDVRTLTNPKNLDAALKDFDSKVLLFDAKTFGTEGPGIVGAINAEKPALRVVVMASADCILEPAYRIRRIFYYAVEPFADNEITEILAGAFVPPPTPSLGAHNAELAQPLGGIFITNRNRTRVRLIPAPGLLRRESGLGLLLRHRLMEERFPLESSPSETPITPMNLLSSAAHCDRVIVLLAKEHGRLPGCVTRDTKAEYIAMIGAGADKVTTVLVEPSGVAEYPLGFEPQVVEALADYLVREMASC